MRGRKPIAAETHLIEKPKVYGELKDRIENEPEELVEIEPKCPVVFRPSEKECWEYLADILRNRGIFIDINGPLLEMAAVYMAELRNCHLNIVQKGRGNSLARNPAIKERNKAAEILVKILSELNISTSGMARLGSLIAKGKKKTGMEELID